MRMSYGYYRSEILGALFSTLVIWCLTGTLVYMAVLRVMYPTFSVEPVPMLVTASCGIVFNIIMWNVLHTNSCFQGVHLSHHGHSHSGDDSHAHSHDLEKIKVNDSNNINLRAAAIHVIGDFVQSIGVLIAAIFIYIDVILLKNCVLCLKN
jgi:zinc transporter 2